MASGITILAQPQAFMPCFTPHFWTASSTNVAQTNFKYRIVVTDLISGTVSPFYPIPPRPDTKCVFNSATYAQKFITQLNPDGLYGFQVNTGAIRKIRVNIGEIWDIAGVPTYTAGTNVDYIVWNGCLDVLEVPGYNYTDFIWKNLLTNNYNPNYTYPSVAVRFCNDEKTFEGKRNYLNIIGANTNQPAIMNITGRDANGNMIATTEITNPFAGSANYYDRYLFIDIGYKGLQNMPVGQVTGGTFPIPVSQYAYYDVELTAAGVSIPSKRIYVECEHRYNVINLVYRGKRGQWEAFNFSKLSALTSDKVATVMKVLPYSLVSNVYTYSKGSLTEKTITTTTTDGIKINTDWITEAESAYLKELWNSTLIYMDEDGSLVPMKVVNNSYETKYKFNSPLISVSFDLKYTHTNSGQRG